MLISSPSSVVVKELEVFQLFNKQKLCNISGTNAATRRHKMAADLSPLT